jgi:hypothetical protein
MASEPLLGAKIGDDGPPGSYGALMPPSAPYSGMSRVPDARDAHVASIATHGSSVFCCTTPLAGLLGLFCCPLTVIGMPTTIPPRHEAVGTVFGKYVGTWRAPGLYFINPCGLRLYYISVNNRAQELNSIKVSDGSGNSIVVSGVITYRVVDSARAALDMESLESYVRIQAHAVLKRICSRCPYVTYDGSPSLITEQVALGGQLASLLQEKVEIAGVHVISFELADLAYSAEIAPQMLVRQQAQAIIDARKTIVAGAVGIVSDAMGSLAERGLEVAKADQPRLIANLMTVICSEKSPVPTIEM